MKKLLLFSIILATAAAMSGCGTMCKRQRGEGKCPYEASSKAAINTAGLPAD